MSNDECKTSLVNYSNVCLSQSTINSNNKDVYQAIYPSKLSDIYSIASIITPSYQKSSYQTDNVNESKNNNDKSRNNTDKSITDSELMPMNLITNTGLDLSHSIRTPAFATYFNSESLNHNKNYSYISSRCSSTSPSIDVENDDSADRIMSPVSIPSHHQKLLLNDPSQSAFKKMELTAGSIPSGFPLNYHQYANNAALYGAPVMFSGAIHATHASYMAGLPLHAALSPNETYLKAIQAAACGIYSPTAIAPPPPPPATSSSSSLLSGKLSSLPSPTVSSMITLTPSSQSVGISNKTTQQQHPQFSPSMVNNITEIDQQQQQQQQKKKDYIAPSSSQTSSRAIGTNNTSGTYLNDKVNERLRGVDATKDSHFKVPNGKEGSLKHRILRPPSNNETATEQNKNPVMRSYSTTSNFRKGNYIELANGTLRRIEDMRTEDFIQCAERSPHHQLAESTVVKINTSLPITAVITFSYDRNRSKVDMEVPLDHPFFVYGQGWASCNPDMSMKMFGLKCQRLQVGDICISLKKREDEKQKTQQPGSHTAQKCSLTQLNEVNSYQARHNAVSSPNVAHLKSPSMPAMSSTAEMPYSGALNTHSYTIPVPQTNHNLQQQQQQQRQHHHQQVHQQAYAEMAKLMSSYAYAKGIPQLPYEQFKDVVMDAAMLQNLPPKMMSTFYHNQIFQFSQQQQQHQQQHQQNHLQANQQTISNPNYNITSSLSSSLSPQPADLENGCIREQPPQTHPLDVTMSRKRRWSAPENMFDDDESITQPSRNGLSPATART